MSTLASRQRMSSRQRMRCALNRQPVDHIPCCMMSFTALRKRCNENLDQLALAEQAMGLDTTLFIPAAPRPARRDHPDLRGLPVRFDARVQTREWHGSDDVLHKEYVTPAGRLTTAVRLSDDWPHGEHIPFVDDYQIPRAAKPLIVGPEDLAALRYLLIPPLETDIAQFKQEAQTATDFVQEHQILLTGGWGVGMDMANWLCGMENLIVLTMEQPDFVAELLEMIHIWNMQRMQVVLDAGIDLYIRRAWYEGCDFITPRFYRQAVLPRLKAEVALTHEHGAKFGYICSSGLAPLLDLFLEAEIDVLIGIDPVQGTHTDLPLLKQKLGGQVCLWGGVSGAITVEQGGENEVRAAVHRAIHTLGPTGLILSPVDNITVDAPHTWQNMDVLIDEWQRCRAWAGDEQQ